MEDFSANNQHFEKHQSRQAEEARKSASEHLMQGVGVLPAALIMTVGLGWFSGFMALAMQAGAALYSFSKFKSYSAGITQAEVMEDMAKPVRDDWDLAQRTQGIYQQTARLPALLVKAKKFCYLAGAAGLYLLHVASFPVSGFLSAGIAIGGFLGGLSLSMKERNAEDRRRALVETATNARLTSHTVMAETIGGQMCLKFTRDRARNIAALDWVSAPAPQPFRLRHLFSRLARKSDRSQKPPNNPQGPSL